MGGGFVCGGRLELEKDGACGLEGRAVVAALTTSHGLSFQFKLQQQYLLYADA